MHSIFLMLLGNAFHILGPLIFSSFIPYFEVLVVGINKLFIFLAIHNIYGRPFTLTIPFMIYTKPILKIYWCDFIDTVVNLMLVNMENLQTP